MERPQGGVLDDWLASLQPITQHLLLATYLADGQPQPAKDVADVLPQLQDVVEEQGARWLAALLSYHELHSMCVRLGLKFSVPSPTKVECHKLFLTFISSHGINVTTSLLGPEDFNVFSKVQTFLVIHPLYLVYVLLFKRVGECNNHVLHFPGPCAVNSDLRSQGGS
jgi:hypothetical protein